MGNYGVVRVTKVSEIFRFEKFELFWEPGAGTRDDKDESMGPSPSLKENG